MVEYARFKWEYCWLTGNYAGALGQHPKGSGLAGGEDAACDLLWQIGTLGFEPRSMPA